MGIFSKLSKEKIRLDRDVFDSNGVDMHSWGDVQSIHPSPTRSGFNTHHRTLKDGAQLASSVAGVLLPPVGMAKNAINPVLAAKSLRSTVHHVKGLKKIKSAVRSFQCDGDQVVHQTIASVVLPAIIMKKEKKVRKKCTASTVVLSPLVSLEEGARSVYKRATGTRSKQRHFHCEILTTHLVLCHCGLAEAIVTELWGEEEMTHLRAMSSNEAGPHIFEKMSSM
ncbi:hypothetical protein [Parendozoicomonas sp. Alg238-R29]|uniref:hypothetical protein n=1 Tax=Parendozoicomonas sp. Alg238-R29 TaxID=2993446 RepID=UPI00248E2C7B|nr:hypothetical protein [Parendozoicomonas sp. Alg238-R29]